MLFTTTNTGTREWADREINIAKGCENDCHYCYAKSMAVRFKRSTPSSWKEPILNERITKKSFRNFNGVTMFPSSHDITPFNLSESINFMDKQLRVKNDLLIVSKPRFDCIKRICDTFSNYTENILFRYTIGSSNNEVLKFWEPNAPSFEERLESLQYTFNKGFRTSISSEPMLDANIENVINIVRPFVTDSIWLGKVNRLRSYLKLNKVDNPAIYEKADELISMQNDSAILELYNKYKDDSLIKWKDSIKKVVGIELNEKAGMDI